MRAGPSRRFNNGYMEEGACSVSEEMDEGGGGR